MSLSRRKKIKHSKGRYPMKGINIIIGILFILSTLCVSAQLESPQRAEELEKLNIFFGKWKAEGKVYPGEGMPPIKTKGEPEFEWVMHRTWLMFISGEGRLQGHGYMTWDKESGRYAFFWFDNLITKPTGYHGNWLDPQTLALSGKLDFKGKVSYTKITWHFVKEDEIEIVREVSADGKDFRVTAELNYTRVQ
jgi:hypothetical protein